MCRPLYPRFRTDSTMKSPICLSLAGLSLAALPACAIFGILSEEEQKHLDQHRAGAARFYNARQYEKAISQAEKGLVIEPDDYRLLGPLAWSYLQLSLRDSQQNERYLKLSEVAFGDVIAQRSIENHDPRNVFGYAIAQYNWARIEQNRADIWRREAEKDPDRDKKRNKIARAEEHERKATSKDQGAKRYFLHVASGSFTEPANQREAYKYLMAIDYRHGKHAEAIAFGAKALSKNAEEVKIWEEEYARTEFAAREHIIRAELANLKADELKVRSRLAAYYQQLAKRPKNANFKKDYDAALVHLNAILAARPNSSEDYYFRGVCYRALGQHEAAHKDFQLFLRLGKLSKEHKAVKDAQKYLYGRGR